MKFESDKKEKTVIPVAFIDVGGNLWFRSKDASDVMDNDVFVIKAGENTSMDSYDMNVFVTCIKNLEQRLDDTYTVKKFYEGDSVTITF